jgi:hypothetical protein
VLLGGRIPFCVESRKKAMLRSKQECICVLYVVSRKEAVLCGKEEASFAIW